MKIRYTTDFFCDGWFENREHFMRFVAACIKTGEVSKGVARKLRKWSMSPAVGDIVTITGADNITFENFQIN